MQPGALKAVASSAHPNPRCLYAGGWSQRRRWGGAELPVEDEAEVEAAGAPPAKTAVEVLKARGQMEV